MNTSPPRVSDRVDLGAASHMARLKSISGCRLNKFRLVDRF